MKTTAVKIARGLLWLVYLWVAITLVLLTLMFLLQLFGANPTAGFVDWVYRSTERAMAPFRGIFEPVTLSNQSVLDVSVLFAMIVYLFVALGLHLLIDWLTGRLRQQERLAERQALVAAANGPQQVVHVTGPTGVVASAVLQPGLAGTTVGLSAAGLDPSDTYTAWLEGLDGSRLSTATFQPSKVGTADVMLTSAATLSGSRAFGITMLPRPGETTSTDIVVSRIG